MKRKYYTKEEINFIRENYGKITQEEIAIKINHSLNSVKNIAYKLRKKGENLFSELDHSKQQIEKMKEKKSFPINNSIYQNRLELAYIIGVLNGDGNLSTRRINLTSTDKDFSINFKNKLEKWSGLKAKMYKYFDTKSHYYSRGYHYETMLNAIKIKKILEKYYISKNGNEAIKNIKEFLNNPKLEIEFIKGFFDSEGSIRKNNRIAIDNNNKELINLIVNILKNLKINTKIYTEKRINIRLSKNTKQTIKATKKMIRIYVQNKEDIKQFCSIIDSSIKRKQNRIIAIRNKKEE